MTPTTFTYRFKLILKKNGLPRELNVHSLRHTAASLMIAGGTDVATVAGILGHSQPSTTLDIYYPRLRQEQKGRQRGTARDAGDIDHTSKRTGSIRIRESSLSFCGLFKQQFSTHSV